jgi:hypothetical protein
MDDAGQMFLLGRKVAVLAFLLVGTAPSRPAIAGRVALESQLSIWDWRRQIKFNHLAAPKAEVCPFYCKCLASAVRSAELDRAFLNNLLNEVALPLGQGDASAAVRSMRDRRPSVSNKCCGADDRVKAKVPTIKQRSR